MPIYDYDCACGRFEAVRRYEDGVINCPNCGGVAERVPVYRDQAVVMKGLGFTKSLSVGPVHLPEPRASDAEERQEERRKALSRAGWNGDRARDFIRKGMMTDNTGSRRFDPQRAAKAG